MKLSVNILTWNTVDTLIMTLYLIKEELVDIDYEVIVVDNNSTDGCQEYADIANKTNLGTAVGKNQGIKASKGEYIFLLDGDVVPVKNTIPQMVEYLDEHKEADAIGFCRNKFTDNKNTAEKESYVLYNPREYDYICLYYGMFRREVFDNIMLDENYSGEGYGWEDRDFWETFNRAGFKQHVADINYHGGRYFHRINSSIRTMGRDKMVETSKERYEYFKKKWGVGNYAAG